jgi:uncharacterized protein (DUF885 family)
MIRNASFLAASVCLSALSACATGSDVRVQTASGASEAVAPAPATSPVEVANAGKQLHGLFKASDEANLRRNPLSALFRGDYRYADQLGDFLTDAYTEAERKAAQDDLARLAAIDRAALSPTDRIAYDVFKRDQELTLRALSPEILPLTDVRPIDHFFGFHTFYPDLASGQARRRSRPLQDYENNLKRHGQYAALVGSRDRALPPGMASGSSSPSWSCATSSTSSTSRSIRVSKARRSTGR